MQSHFEEPNFRKDFPDTGEGKRHGCPKASRHAHSLGTGRGLKTKGFFVFLFVVKTRKSPKRPLASTKSQPLVLSYGLDRTGTVPQERNFRRVLPDPFSSTFKESQTNATLQRKKLRRESAPGASKTSRNRFFFPRRGGGGEVIRKKARKALSDAF